MNFDEMLNSVYCKLGMTTKTKLTLQAPELSITTTNTYWKNVKAFLKTINRSPEHFVDFLKKDLDVNWLSSSKSDGLVIIGKIKKDKIMRLMQQYMRQFVVCKTCNSGNSIMKFNNTIRKYDFTCNDCHATYTL